MKIIASLSPKGGPGKTTILYNLGKYLHDKGFKVLLLDADKNASMLRMYERRIDYVEGELGVEVNFPNVQTINADSVKKIDRYLAQQGEGFDFVLVDTFGTIAKFHTDLVYEVDLVIVPVQPNQSAVDNGLLSCEFLDGVRADNENRPIYGVTLLNFAKNGQAEREYRREFEDAYQFSVETRPYGKAYKLADLRGLSVTELDKGVLKSKKDEESCKNAAIDMRRLCQEIFETVS